MTVKILVAVFLVILMPVSAHAHERFIADVEFEKWARHCHTSVHKYFEPSGEKLLRKEYCWAIYQKQVENFDDYEVGFVIIVDAELSPYSFEIRSVNFFGSGFTLQIDDNEPIEFACHADFCDPIGREHSEVLNQQATIIDQLENGKMLFLREKQLSDNAKRHEVSISLDGFTSAIAP